MTAEQPMKDRKIENSREFQIEVNDRRVKAAFAYNSGGEMPEGVDKEQYTPPKDLRTKTRRRMRQLDGLKGIKRGE